MRRKQSLSEDVTLEKGNTEKQSFGEQLLTEVFLSKVTRKEQSLGEKYRKVQSYSYFIDILVTQWVVQRRVVTHAEEQMHRGGD